MKKFNCILITLFVFGFTLQAQVQSKVILKSFDTESIDISKVKKEMSESEYIHIGFTPSYGKGIKGGALDLTADVPLRIPLILDQSETPDYSKSFALDLWIKTKKGAPQGTPIASNKKNKDTKGAGWILGTARSGAWYFNLSDGENSYDYEPTAERQSINDGNWHHLAVSIDMEKQELWLYFDGRNVAIYNIAGLKDVSSKLKTVIGGSDEYNDWGSRGEWTAFNGLIDEVRIQNKSLTAKEVTSIFSNLVPSSQSQTLIPSEKVKIQVWNIWHGGHRMGEHVGVERTIDVLKNNNADIIGLIETYGSGAIIADSLGYYFYLISSNLSIMSRYPIESTIKVFKPFFSGGALLDIGNNNKLAFFDIWLNYRPDECELFKGKEIVSAFLKEEKETRQAEITSILKDIKAYTDNSDKVPVIMVGDFNCGSHLDWTEANKKQHFDLVIDWQVSNSMINSGYKDSFREINPDPLKDPGFTWSPLINPVTPNQNCVRDRIDFIYYRGNLTPYRSRTISDHPIFWPSDHASVLTWFYLK